MIIIDNCVGQFDVIPCFAFFSRISLAENQQRVKAMQEKIQLLLRANSKAETYLEPCFTSMMDTFCENHLIHLKLSLKFLEICSKHVFAWV